MKDRKKERGGKTTKIINDLTYFETWWLHQLFGLPAIDYRIQSLIEKKVN